MSLLGSCYAYGTGVEKDGSEAVKWYRKSAEAGGNAGVMTILSRHYQYGIGVEKDMDQAQYWTQRAIEAISKRRDE